MAGTFNLTQAELALGYFEGTTLKPGGGVIAGYSNTMGDLLHEWTMNYLDSEAEEDRIGSVTLTRNGGVMKTPDGQTGWAATLDGTGTLSADYVLPATASVVIVFKRSQTGVMGLFNVTDQLKVWIDDSGLVNVEFTDDTGTAHTYTFTTGISLDEWHQVTVGVGSGVIRCTLDGNLEVDVTGQSWNGLNIPTSGTFTIGSDGTNGFVGQIDRVKVYDRVLGVQDASDEFAWNCILGDFPATAHYRTPWLECDTSLVEALQSFSWSSSKPSGTNLTAYQSNKGLIATDSVTGTTYEKVRRALASDTFQAWALYSTSNIYLHQPYVALAFEFTQA